jgi:hypothetical protein
VLYHGPVRVPVDAAPSKALLRLELPKDCGHIAVPTDLPVELVLKAK